MSRAISLGVLWRSAPSTSAIMRSTNESPGEEEMRTTIWSDNTTVPPVTALRSPPDSRITGADSPVMADSSTVAMPSTTSPSPGMVSPAATSTRSPTCSRVDGTVSVCRSPPDPRRTRAVVSRVTLRRLSACARPRPSATDSASAANSTVAHSHAAVAQLNTLGWSAARIVVSSDPTQTTNRTGLRAWWRGPSLRTAVGSEPRRAPASDPGRPRGAVGATGRSSATAPGDGVDVDERAGPGAGAEPGRGVDAVIAVPPRWGPERGREGRSGWSPARPRR